MMEGPLDDMLRSNESFSSLLWADRSAAIVHTMLLIASTSGGVMSNCPYDFDGRARKGIGVPSGRPTCCHGCTGVHGATPAKDRKPSRQRHKVSRSEAHSYRIEAIHMSAISNQQMRTFWQWAITVALVKCLSVVAQRPAGYLAYYPCA